MELSIIIPSYKRADLLFYGLDSLSKQTIKSSYEVIVLNDGVRDDTAKICNLFKDRLNIRHIFTGHRNSPEPVWRIPGFAINIGARMARGRSMIIMCPEIYILDDCIQTIIDTLRKNPHALIITDGKDDQDENFLKKVKEKESINRLLDLYPSMPGLNTDLPFFFGLNTQSFIEIGGYDEDFIGNCWDDQDIVKRLHQNGGKHKKIDFRVVHLYHSRLRYDAKKVKELWDYNKKLYDEKFGTITRNVGKNWGSLVTSIDNKQPNKLEKHFTTIYESNKWNGKDSRSGTGSDLEHTAIMRPQLVDLVNYLNVTTLLDLPCGDFHWMKEVVGQLEIKEYIGADIVKPMLKDCTDKYTGTLKPIDPKFIYLNAIEDVPPKVDLILCRDGLVHFSYKTIMTILKNFVASGSTYLVMTTFTDPERPFKDVTDSVWHPLNFQCPPFSFPAPYKLILEGCIEGQGNYPDKSLGVWKISDLKSFIEPTPANLAPTILSQPASKDSKIDDFKPNITLATYTPNKPAIVIPTNRNIKLKVAHIHPWWDSAGVGIIHTIMMNKYTDIEVRHIVAGVTSLGHDTDLILGVHDEEIKKVLQEADVLHFNTFWYDDPQLQYKFPWAKYVKGKKLIFHMHGGSICFDYKKLEEISKVATLVTCSPLIPKFMSFTTWVPNIIPISEPQYLPTERESKRPFRFLFMVNHDHNKGRAEIEWLFHKLNNIYGYTILFESWLHRYSYMEGLEQRKAFDMVIDNITQGFIGMVGWETLCQEQICFARLAPETLECYTKLGEGTPPPIINVSGIDELAQQIIQFSSGKKNIQTIKKQGRSWMEKYYNPKRLCKQWEQRYLEIMKS